MLLHGLYLRQPTSPHIGLGTRPMVPAAHLLAGASNVASGGVGGAAHGTSGAPVVVGWCGRVVGGEGVAHPSPPDVLAVALLWWTGARLYGLVHELATGNVDRDRRARSFRR